MIKRKSMPEFEKGRQVAIVKMAEEYENFPEDWVETFPTIMVEAVNTTIQLLQARSDFQEAFESAVIASNLEEAVEMEVFIDGLYVSKEQAGEDVQFDGEKAFVIVDKPQLYNVFDGDHGEYNLKLVVNEGFTFHAFTFG